MSTTIKRSTRSAASAEKVGSKKTPAKKTAKKTPAKKTPAKKTAKKTSAKKETSAGSAIKKKSVSRAKTIQQFSTNIAEGKHLVIVESPAKAKTIRGYLGNHVDVQASFGHVSDLPAKTLGVDLKNNFTPTYEISPEKKKLVADLRKRIQGVDGVWLATDEDREGEAIAWHVAQALGLPVDTTPRIVFHEITKEAIHRAVLEPRTINMDLVNAQQARRVLDRIVGFSISPVLWTKIRRGLSAGRVQSVAVKLIIEKEKEIQNFKPEESWRAFADLTYQNYTLRVELVKVQGKEPILRSYSDIETILQAYTIFVDKNITRDEKSGYQIVSEDLMKSFILEDIIIKQGKKNPSAPFITSSLQQEASRRFGWSVKQVMGVAQKLYEAGFITYMRTDSTNLSALALGTAKKYITETFGERYHQVRQYASKSKNAQEAHEAIRPSYIDRSPEKSGLSGQELSLYRLIWQRTIASQMASAEVEQTTYHFSPERIPHIRMIQGEVITFDGFLALYERAKSVAVKSGDETDEDGDEDVGQKDILLPKIAKGTSCISQQLEAKQHFSKPPARYTESALVKALESHGIGRPSTYAPTISTIQDRGYVEKKDDKKLYPTEIAFHVDEYLEKHFANMMTYTFTAKMEDELDSIAIGDKKRTEMLQSFYKGFELEIQDAKNGEKAVMLVGKNCPKCKDGNLVYKFTKFGKFVGCDHYPECDYTEKTQEEQDTLAPLRVKYEGQPCPEGGTIVVKMGRFGPFLTSSLYPEVKWISSIPDENIQSLEAEHGGKSCPDCGEGTLVVKKARRGNYFLACSRYPDCKHAENIPGQAAGGGTFRKKKITQSKSVIKNKNTTKKK